MSPRAVCSCGGSPEPRRYTQVNDTDHVTLQCPDCGARGGGWLPKHRFNMNILPAFDHEMRAATGKSHERLESEYSQVRLKAPDSARWWKTYGDYLESPQWRSRRELVLARDNQTCQACLKATATQVHHTTYAHVGNEPLFELVSICVPCHDQITALDRAGRT